MPDAVTLAAVVTATATVAYTIGTFVLVNESRKQRKAQIRPQVDIYAEPLGGMAFYVTIQNVGNNPARDIHVAFETSVEGMKTKYMRDIHETFSSLNIPHLSPGKRLRYLIVAEAKDFNIDQTVTSKITYKDVENNSHTSYVDWNISRIKDSTINDEVKDFHKKVPQELKKINDNLRKLQK